MERIRLILPNGRIFLHDYAWSQFSAILAAIAEGDKDAFYNKIEVVTVTDSDYMPAGTRIKYVGTY